MKQRLTITQKAVFVTVPLTLLHEEKKGLIIFLQVKYVTSSRWWIPNVNVGRCVLMGGGNFNELVKTNANKGLVYHLSLACSLQHSIGHIKSLIDCVVVCALLTITLNTWP